MVRCTTRKQGWLVSGDEDGELLNAPGGLFYFFPIGAQHDASGAQFVFFLFAAPFILVLGEVVVERKRHGSFRGGSTLASFLFCTTRDICLKFILIFSFFFLLVKLVLLLRWHTRTGRCAERVGWASGAFGASTRDAGWAAVWCRGLFPRRLKLPFREDQV